METRSAGRRAALIDVALFCAAALSVWPVLLAADLYVHNRHDVGGTLNVAGYKGKVLGPKRPGEVRVGVLGSSTVYGYLLPAEDSVPARMEQPLAAALERSVSVANLGGNGESAACYPDTLRDFDYLDPDAIVLYSGDADLAEAAAERDPSTCVRRRSPIFAATGYFPVIAEVVREKYYALRYGSVDAGYRENYALAPRSAASGIGAVPGAPGASSSAEAPATPAISNPHAATVPIFVARTREIVRTQLARGRAVVVVAEPSLSSAYRAQQAALRAGLEPYSQTPGFAYVDLMDAVDLTDAALSFDRLHLTPDGARIVAAALSAPVAAAIRAVVRTER